MDRQHDNRDNRDRDSTTDNNRRGDEGGRPSHPQHPPSAAAAGAGGQQPPWGMGWPIPPPWMGPGSKYWVILTRFHSQNLKILSC